MMHSYFIPVVYIFGNITGLLVHFRITEYIFYPDREEQLKGIDFDGELEKK